MDSQYCTGLSNIVSPVFIIWENNLFFQVIHYKADSEQESYAAKIAILAKIAGYHATVVKECSSAQQRPESQWEVSEFFKTIMMVLHGKIGILHIWFHFWQTLIFSPFRKAVKNIFHWTISWTYNWQNMFPSWPRPRVVQILTRIWKSASSTS